MDEEKKEQSENKDEIKPEESVSETEKAEEKKPEDKKPEETEKTEPKKEEEKKTVLPSAPRTEKKPGKGKAVLKWICAVVISAAAAFAGGFYGARYAVKEEMKDISSSISSFNPFSFLPNGSDEFSGGQTAPQENTNKAALGVYVQETQNGITVAGFTSNSKAETAGIKAGDIVEKLDDTEVSSVSDMRSFLADKNVGDKVTMTVKRDGEEKSIEVELVANEPSSQSSESPQGGTDNHSDFPSDSDSEIQG